MNFQNCCSKVLTINHHSSFRVEILNSIFLQILKDNFATKCWREHTQLCALGICPSNLRKYFIIAIKTLSEPLYLSKRSFAKYQNFLFCYIFSDILISVKLIIWSAWSFVVSYWECNSYTGPFRNLLGII